MPALSFEQIREGIAGRCGDAVGPAVEGKDPFVVVEADRILEVCRLLHDEPTLALDYLIDVTGVDYPQEKLIRVVYHLWSMRHRHGFKLKVELDRAEAKLASVSSIWHGANWLEREIYDLMGVSFEGHPDLRRLMMPDDWVGHPLRKDWEEQGGYGGISNVRVSPLQQHLEHDRAVRALAASRAPAAPAPAAADQAGKPVEPAAPVESGKPVEAAAPVAPADPAQARPESTGQTVAPESSAAPGEPPKPAAGSGQ